MNDLVPGSLASDAPAAGRGGARRPNLVLLGLIGYFLALSLGADLRPGRKFYFSAEAAKMTPFFRLDRISPALRYYPGNTVESFDSLSFLLSLKLVHALVPARLWSLRLVSVLATAASLVFLFRMAARLFSRRVALIGIFLLVSSPSWVESMRAFGLIPLSHLFVVAACYYLSALGDGRKTVVTAAALALALFGLLSCYLPGRLVFWLGLGYALLYPRAVGKRWLAALAIFFGGLLLLDALLGAPAFDLREFLFPAIGGEWVVKDGRIQEAQLADNIIRNTPILLRYLSPSRPGLYFPLYLPGLLAGLGLCLARRRRRDVFLLLYFAAFFISPITSNGIPFRRMVLALDPLHLLIAVGLSWAYDRLRERCPSPGARHLLAAGGILAALLLGAVSFGEVLLRASRPVPAPSRGELKTLAAFILGRGEAHGRVIHDDRLGDLIWGNPDFAESVTAALNEKMYFAPPGSAQNVMEGALQTAHSVLLLYPDWAGDSYRPALEWARGAFPDQLEEGPVGALGIRYLSLRPPPGLVPELLSSEGAEISASSVLRRPGSAFFNKDNLANNLTDGDPTSVWEPVVVEGAWVQVDFGRNGGKRVAVIGAQPAGDHPGAPGFLRSADFLGSRDGLVWEPIAVIRDAAPASTSPWRYWVLPALPAFRYYRLAIRAPSPGEGPPFLGLGDLALYESENNYPLRFGGHRPIASR